MSVARFIEQCLGTHCYAVLGLYFLHTYNFIHHKIANNSKKYATIETKNGETDNILTNLHTIYRSE